jgi:hypothetical protein
VGSYKKSSYQRTEKPDSPPVQAGLVFSTLVLPSLSPNYPNWRDITLFWRHITPWPTFLTGYQPHLSSSGFSMADILATDF